MDGHRVRFQPAAAESPCPHTARQQVSLQLRYMSSHFQAALAGHLAGSNTATSTRDAMQAYLEGDTTGKDRSSHAMPLPMPGGAWPGNGDSGQATLGCDVPAGRLAGVLGLDRDECCVSAGAVYRSKTSSKSGTSSSPSPRDQSSERWRPPV